jgi:uncharacterized heparinase superfamily protein
MWNKVRRYYDTLKHLKWKQIRYQLFYRIRKQIFGPPVYADLKADQVPTPQHLHFQPSLNSYSSFNSPPSFTFLNLGHSFHSEIDWNFSGYGKLWTYNLNYFEFLLQENVSKEQGLLLIRDFMDNINDARDGLEPYPTSLRIIFWIRFLIKYGIKDQEISKSLFVQANILKKNIEYHLLGNHLLENGFALLFAAYYFKEKSFYKKATKIISEELEEQVLPDGGHFELSPMYHQIIFYRLLDAVNLVQNNKDFFETDLAKFLTKKATAMLGWLRIMTFKNGSIPLFNDSAFGIAPESESLFKYAEELKITDPPNISLKESGYRKIVKDKYEMILDIGQIGPNYIPGHAHSDIFNFELYINGKPFIVDTGTSTYEKNNRRELERSTESHNTVMVGNYEQSEVWGGFRVARRARPKVLMDQSYHIVATHNGYGFLGVKHQRSFTFQSKEILIEDQLEENNKYIAKAFLHFHPQVKVEILDDQIKTNQATISIQGAIKIENNSFEYVPEFNKKLASTKIIVTFTEELKMTITL